MARPHCSVFVGVSLDGYLARRDDGLDWLRPFEGEEHGYKEFFSAVDTLVVGRRTYEVVRSFPAWPYGGKRCVVLTHRPLQPAHGEEASAEAPAALAARLCAEGARRIYVDGGLVIRQFLDAGLVSDLTVTIVPVLLGDGIPLFPPGGVPRSLTLAESRAFPKGMVQLRYRCAG